MKIITAAMVGAFFLAFPTQAQTPKAEAPRYQITCQPATQNILGDCYLLDTVTGKVWREIHLDSSDGDDLGLSGSPEMWVLMPRIDSKAELDAFSARHPKSSQ